MAIDLGNLVLELVPRVHAPCMRAKRAFEALGIVIVVQKIVVALRIGTELWVIILWTEREGRTAAPAPHHLGSQPFFLRRAGGACRQVSAEPADPLMPLSHAPLHP